ncbi:MAG: hypothetical protein HKN58_07760, partial [Xanthomonadales bacterium]|nr:hypothetical protein [Xanthomonadales bacterium]
MRAVVACWLLLGFFQSPSHAAVAVDTRQLQLEFSPFGDLTTLTACLPSCSDPGARRQQFTSYRGFLTANRNTNSLFELQRRNGERSIELLFTNLVSGETRRWRIPHGGYQLGVELTRPEGLVMAAGQALERPAGAGFTAWLESIRLLELAEDGLAQYDPEAGVGPLDAGGDWIGFRNRYWAAMIKPEGQEQARVPAAADVSDLKWELAGADATSARYTVYAGPVTHEALSAADRELAVLAWSDLPPGLRWIGKALHAMLGWMHG